MSNRRRLIKYLKQQGGKPDDVTWSELADNFHIKPPEGSSDPSRAAGKRACDYWRWYLDQGVKHNALVPDEIEDRNPEAPYDNLVTKSVWESPKKGGGKQLLHSWKHAAQPEQIEKFRADLISDIIQHKPSTSIPPPIKTKGEFAYEISIPDFHLGRVPLHKVQGVYLDTLDELVSKACGKYDISEFALILGNDYFNSDTHKYTTTRGTDQFDYDKWYETFRVGWQTLVEACDMLSQIAPVEVKVVLGNHDHQRMYYCGDVLRAYFKDHPNIRIDNDYENFKFYEYGNTLIMLNHGEIKWNKYPLIMADENPEGWARTTFREVHVGHLHKSMTLDEYRGVRVRYLPSIAPNSDWEDGEGYRNQKEATGMLWHEEEGLYSYIPVTVNEDEQGRN